MESNEENTADGVSAEYGGLLISAPRLALKFISHTQVKRAACEWITHVKAYELVPTLLYKWEDHFAQWETLG